MESFRPTASSLQIWWRWHNRNILFNFCQLWVVALVHTWRSQFFDVCTNKQGHIINIFVWSLYFYISFLVLQKASFTNDMFLLCKPSFEFYNFKQSFKLRYLRRIEKCDKTLFEIIGHDSRVLFLFAISSSSSWLLSWIRYIGSSLASLFAFKFFIKERSLSNN